MPLPGRLRFSPGCGCCCYDLWTITNSVRTSVSTTDLSRTAFDLKAHKFTANLDIQEAQQSRIDQRNRLVFFGRDYPNAGASGLGAFIRYCSMSLKPVPDQNIAPADVTTVYSNPTAGGTIRTAETMALDKQNEVVYFIELEVTGGTRDANIKKVNYDGTGLTTIRNLLSGSATVRLYGVSALSVESGWLYYFSYTSALYELYRVKTDGTDLATLISVTRGPTDPTGPVLAQSLTVDPSRGKLWWYDTRPSSQDYVVNSMNLDGTGAATHAYGQQRLGFLQYSNMLDRLVFSLYRNQPIASDADGGIFIADPDFTNHERIFQSLQAINGDTGLPQNRRFNTEGELGCGFEHLGGRYVW